MKDLREGRISLNHQALGYAIRMNPLYIFLDESGDFNFSLGGTKYFMLTAISLTRPFPFDTPLSDYRQDVIEWGRDLEYFHASEDNAHVRQRVFQTICACLALLRADAIVVEKCKAAPSLQVDERFYPRMLGCLLGYVFRGIDMTHISQVIVITDRIPVKRKRRAIEKGIKEHPASVLPYKVPYRVLHHESKSWYGLQVADYVNWAIFRKWERGDSTAANLVQPCIKSEFDIFHFIQKRYY